MLHSHESRCLILTRDVLLPIKMDIPFEKITIHDFTLEGFQDKFEKHEIIIFINIHPNRVLKDAGKTKILKNKWGYAGPVAKDSNKKALSKGTWQAEEDERGFSGYRCINCDTWISIPSIPCCKCDQP